MEIFEAQILALTTKYFSVDHTEASLRVTSNVACMHRQRKPRDTYILILNGFAEHAWHVEVE